MDTENNSEVMYSTADVSKLLKVGSPMVRKWALAYEKFTNDTVSLKSKRDGRYFTHAQVSTISAAKKLVDRENLKIDTALKMVTGQPQLAATVSSDELEGKDTLKALETILARNDETNRALLEEIRGLRQDLANKSVVQALPHSEDRHYSPIQRLLRRWLGL